MKRVPPGLLPQPQASAHLLKEFPAVGVVIVSKVHDSLGTWWGWVLLSPTAPPPLRSQSRALFRCSTPRGRTQPGSPSRSRWALGVRTARCVKRRPEAASSPETNGVGPSASSTSSQCSRGTRLRVWDSRTSSAFCTNLQGERCRRERGGHHLPTPAGTYVFFWATPSTLTTFP